jgi:hypothetical protein
MTLAKRLSEKTLKNQGLSRLSQSALREFA